jgi:signal transduction histidine kinase
MSSILFKIRFFVLVSVLIFGASLMVCVQSFIDWRDTYSDLKESWKIEAYLKSTTMKPIEAETLVSWRKELKPQFRQEALSSIIQAINNRLTRSYPEKVRFFIAQETEYRKFLAQKLEALRSKIIWCLYLVIVCFIVATIFMSIYIQSSIFKPLNALYLRMLDFLNDRYTYEFQAPEANEIGDLQSTFNSLAQRVINNIEELKTLDSAKTEFLNIASHELRTPLTSIKGSLSLLRNGVSGELNDNASKLLLIAETETDRLIRLINDLLDLAKIEAKKLPLEEKWYQVEELIGETVASLQGLTESTQVSLSIKDQLPIDIFIDKDRVHQVLTNLLSNAIKYSPQQGIVSVNYFVNGNHQLVIEVSDQGRGIAPEDQKQIFEKFRQATNDISPLVKGTGLGLAIARAIIEEHGGEIGVKSQPKKGSTFYFTLPKWKYRKTRPGVAA